MQAYLDRVAQEVGSIDILLNVMGPQAKDYGNGTSTMELPLEQFLLPLSTLVPSQFITARAAARHMVRQHSGVILFVTAIPVRGISNATAIGSAFGAMESLLRCLATDLGPAGVRVVGIRSGAMVDTRTIQQSFENAVHAWGSRKSKSCPCLNRERFSSASRPLPTRHGWLLFSPRMGREPSPALL